MGLGQVLPVVGVVVDVEDVANSGGASNEVYEQAGGSGVHVQLLEEALAIRKGVEGHRDGGAHAPGVILVQRDGVGVLGGWLGFHAGLVQLVQEELHVDIEKIQSCHPINEKEGQFRLEKWE